MPDVVERIEKDHRAVEELFAQFNESYDRAIAEQICDELEQHTKAEEQAVYPVMKAELREGDQEINEAEHEHADAKKLIDRVRSSTDDNELVSLMSELEAAIHHHVQEEEGEILPQAREELPSDELEELGKKFEAAKG